MLFYGDQNNPELSRKLAKVHQTRALFPQIQTFPDGEKRIKLSNKISGEDVIILKSFIPDINSSLVDLCLTLDAAKRSGAKSITLVCPYFPYQRAERIFEPGEGIPLAAISKIIESAGPDKIIVIDPHIDNLQEFFKIPVKVISTTELFLPQIQKLNKKYPDISLVSPDKGGEWKVIDLQTLVKTTNTVVLSKNRNHTTGKVSIQSYSGKIEEVCVIIDDMITTGNTILEATNYLVSHGAKQIYVMATHPVFSADMNPLFANPFIEEIYVTDSIPMSRENNTTKLKILSITSLLNSLI